MSAVFVLKKITRFKHAILAAGITLKKMFTIGDLYRAKLPLFLIMFQQKQKNSAGKKFVIEF